MGNAFRPLTYCLAIVVGLTFACLPASAQPRKAPVLRLGGVTPSGVHVAATESWQSYEFVVANASDVDRLARVCMFYEGQSDVQYGRDIWVPAHSEISSWLLAGPARVKPGTRAEIQTVLYDRTDGSDTLVLPATEEKIRSRVVIYRPQQPFTAIIVDEDPPDESTDGKLPQPDSPADEAMEFARTFRLARDPDARTMSEHLNFVNARTLPVTPEAYQGIRHFVVATNRIARDPAGVQALRRWVEHGGRLWVMLDMVAPETIAPLLGDALDFQVVDRVGLTTTKIITPADEADPRGVVTQQHERPVQLVRVLLPPGETAPQTIQGWPAQFQRSIGRGKVIITTVGARAWHRPRQANEPRAKYQTLPNLPVPTLPLVELAETLHPPDEKNPFRLSQFEPMLSDDIGYAIASRGLVVGIFVGFLAAALVLGLLLRSSRRPELLGWLGPLAALGAAGVYFGLAEVSRRSTPPIVAVAQVVDAVSGQDEVAVHGLLAAFRPVEGTAPLGAREGGLFELDMAGIAKTRRFILTDAGAWHWDGLDLPAGIRLAPFRTNLATPTPVRATAQFGPDGVTGSLAAKSFQELGDALIATSSGRIMAVRINADGTFAAGSQDILPPAQFLASAVLSDRQQRRQELYRAMLQREDMARADGPPVLMTWAQPADMQFAFAPDARVTGNALLLAPLHWQRTPAGQRVVIPGPLLPYRRIINGAPNRPTLEGTQRTEMDLRFQLPAAVLPLKVERARVTAKIEAPNRNVAIGAPVDGKVVEAHRVASPLDVIRVDMADERQLRLDADGGLHIHLTLSEPIRKGAQADVRGPEKWVIEYFEVEVMGTVSGP